jgi:hypothetical protein
MLHLLPFTTFGEIAAFGLEVHVSCSRCHNRAASCSTMAGFCPELDEADKSSEHDQYLNRRYRRAVAYEVLDGLLTTAIQKHQQVEEQLASFLKSSHRSGAILRAGRQRTPRPNQPPTAQLAPVLVPVFSFQLGLITALV